MKPGSNIALATILGGLIMSCAGLAVVAGMDYWAGKQPEQQTAEQSGRRAEGEKQRLAALRMIGP